MCPTYEVIYTIKHKRIFKVPDENYIRCILNDTNDVEVIEITKLMEDY